MLKAMKASPDKPTHSRRMFIKGALAGAGTLATAGTMEARTQSSQERDPRKEHPIEWRNRQSGMAYRQLGKTGLMISEVVQGGSGPMLPETWQRFNYAIERGLNYFDTSSRYSGGKSEEGLGMLLRQPGVRDKVFVSTKVASYTAVTNTIRDEIFKGLPGEKQEALRKKAIEMLEERGVRKPGYFYPYFGGHYESVERDYLGLVIKREYGYQREWKTRIKQAMFETLDTSLRRLGTDYVDICHCPHGIRLPEELDDEIIDEFFETVKRQGKIRFTSYSCHTDAPRILEKAVAQRSRDLAMSTYNIANQGSMEGPIERAHQDGMGFIAMKVAAAVQTRFEALKPIPEWRIQKLKMTVPGKYSLPARAYLWALQNPHISAVISEMYDHDMMRDNFTIVGKKIDLMPA